MDFTNILDIVMKILGVLTAGFILSCMPKVYAFLETKVGAEKAAYIKELIKQFVKSAEQSLKADDPTGEARKEYVEDALMDLEIEITSVVNDYIEAAVHDINLTNLVEVATSGKTTKKK